MVERLDRTRTVLAVIDMQEGFRAIIADFGPVAARIAIAVAGARALGVATLVTEQYPEGLKATAEEIRPHLGDGVAPLSKLCFSACGQDEFVARLQTLNARHVLLCGIEAHICVTQTALDLLSQGFGVHLLADAITSRDAGNKTAALARLTQAGAVHSTVEMALFELMGRAGTAEFKAVQKLVK